MWPRIPAGKIGRLSLEPFSVQDRGETVAGVLEQSPTLRVLDAQCWGG